MCGFHPAEEGELDDGFIDGFHKGGQLWRTTCVRRFLTDTMLTESIGCAAPYLVSARRFLTWLILIPLALWAEAVATGNDEGAVFVGEILEYLFYIRSLQGGVTAFLCEWVDVLVILMSY